MEFNDNCKNIISLLKKLSTVSIEVGVFEEDANVEDTVSIVNLDGTVSNISMTISDIMYFTEYGTISIPGKEIISDIIDEISKILNIRLEEISERIFTGSISTQNEILSRLEIILTEINYDIIPRTINNKINKLNNINMILNSDKDNNYIYDISKLSKYIKCKIHYNF